MRSENGERISTANLGPSRLHDSLPNTYRSLSSSSPLPTTESSCSALCAGVSAIILVFMITLSFTLLGDCIVRPSRSSGAGRGTSLSLHRNVKRQGLVIHGPEESGALHHASTAQRSTAQHSSIVRKGTQSGNHGQKVGWNIIVPSACSHGCWTLPPQNETSRCMVMYV